ncbi:YicC/YloC family endoribonuclease [Kordiimonas aquimaris]|uniref:YicC/YloC family endoribonuclease n=1 Tax=Kordiimonas aquimaris TaxID=707591 RepID=UPI0021D1A68A|nr:YicC/YloC family endoribonuclease [Kordiimonas aquimaris]
MTLKSMTGFARRGGLLDSFRWNLEIKSVNNKGLEVRVKYPVFLDGFDIDIKKSASKALARGSVFINLQVDQADQEENFVVNEKRLNALVTLAKKYKDTEGVAPAQMDGLLAIKGVVELANDEPNEDQVTTLKSALSKELTELLKDLDGAREAEGERMYAFLESQLAEMRALVEAAKDIAGDRAKAMQERFVSQLRKLENTEKPVSDDRLAQEIAVMVVKADIQEELDRLDSHFEEADNLLRDTKPVGRRLDFLCQEFNREANTLCSKASDTRLTKVGVDLKVLIDQFREQIQNIE